MASITWTNLSGGTWSTAGNWSTDTVPTVNDDVWITDPGSYAIQLNAAATVDSLTLNDAAATLTVNAALTSSGTIALDAGTLVLNGAGTIDNATLQMAGGTLVANDGTLSNATIDGTVNLAASARFDITNGTEFFDATGTQPGSIAIDNNLSVMYSVGNNLLDSVSIAIGSAQGGTIDAYDNGGGNAMLTLGPNAIVTQNGAVADFYSALGSGDGITNAGSIALTQSGGTAYFNVNNLINSGSFTVTGETVSFNATTMSNSGSIAVTGGGKLTVGGNWSSTGAISAVNATVVLAGTSTFASVNTVTASSGTLDANGTFDGGGSGTLSVGSGTTLGSMNLENTGRLRNGTVIDNGGGVSFQSGTLDNVAFRGTLDLSGPGAIANLMNGTTVTDITGTNPGLIKVTGNGSVLYEIGTTTLDAVSILIGNASSVTYVSAYDGGGGNDVLTLGPALSVTQTGIYASFAIGSNAGDAIVNQGTINASLHNGRFGTNSGRSFVNQGAILVSNGDAFSSSASTFSNTGVVTVDATSTLTLGGQWSNTGSITSSGQVVLDGAATAAAIGTLDSTGTVVFGGYLDLQGGTLAIGSGTTLGETALFYTGTIHNGTLLDAGGAGMQFQNGTLDGITYQGSMDLSQTVAKVSYVHGLTVTDATGTLPGTISLTGANAAIFADASAALGAATLDAVTLNIGNNVNASVLWAYDVTGFGNAQLDIGPAAQVVQAGLFAQLYAGNAAGDAIVNNGTISAGYAKGYFSDNGRGFTNAATIVASNTDTFAVSAATFSNTGTMSATTGATLQIGGTWSNTGQISANAATLTLAGSTSFTNMGTILRSGGIVNLDGTLEGNGGTLDFGAGTALGQLTLQGLAYVHNGTLEDQGGSSGMLFAGGTFDTVTYAGTLDLSVGAPGFIPSLSFVNSLTLTDASGINPGDILLTGNNANLYGYHDSTLNNATVQIGSNGGATLSAYDNTGGNSVMTLGQNLSIVHTGKSATLYASSSAGDGFLNQGSITASLASGILSVVGHNFSNDTTGMITVGNNDYMIIQSATLTNSGTMSVGGGGTLALSSIWNNLGTIFETGGTLTLGGTGSFGGIGTLDRVGGVIDISGTLNGNGGTLAIGAGTALGALVLQPSGVIRNGTLIDSGSGLVASNGTLSSVTYLGTLDMSGSNTNLNIVNGITFSNLAGTGPGQWNLTGSGASAWIYGTTTLNNATINMGAAGSGATLYEYDNGAPPVTLTLGANLTLAQTGTFAALRASNPSAADRIVNQGTIAAGGSNALFTIAGAGVFTNQGILGVTNGGSLTVAGIGTFSNLSGTTLTGGTYEVGAGSTFQLQNNTSIVTDAADIVLSGAASVLQGLKTSGNTEQTIDNTLGTIATGGTLSLLSGRNFAAGATLTDNGWLQLGGTTLSLAASVNSLAVGSGGTLFGYGTVNFGTGKGSDALANAGLIEANGGTLLIQQPVSGSGGYQIDAAATLELAGSATAASVATFNGAGGVLKLDAPTSFAGTIADFGAGVLIDLTGINATAASISGNTLTVTESGSGTLTYAVANNTSTGALRVASDGHGGTYITGYQLAVASAYAPSPVALPNVHVGDSDTQALTLSNIVSTGTFSESLDASIGSATGAVQVSGAITDLAPGATDTTDLVAGLNTANDGLQSGTAVIALQSDGTPVAGDGYGPVSIGAQTVNVSGAVYAYANPQYSGANEYVGASRVGGPELQGTMTVADGTLADPYQEDLVYSADASASGFQLVSNGAGTVDSGSTADIGLTLPSTTAGVFTGPVVLTLVSTGVGTSGLPDTPLGQTSLDITGKVYTPAVPDVLTSGVDFGSIHVGDTADGTISVSNASVGVLPDVLTGSLDPLSAPFVGNGTLGAGVAQGGTGDIPISFQPTADGLFGSNADLSLASHDGDQADLPLATGPISLSGTAWAYAAPELNATTFNFGATRVGDTETGQPLTITNGTNADPYQENLVYNANQPASLAFAFVGPSSATLDSGDYAGLSLVLGTAYSGDFTGTTMTIDETSSGDGTSGLGDTPLTASTITLNGKVYAPAVAQQTSSAAPFNVHAGQPASEQISFSNLAEGTLNDLLTGGWGTVTGPWQGSGSLNVAAGSSGSLTLTMNTSADGSFSGTANFALDSHDADQSDLALPYAALTLSGTVYGYAAPSLSATTLNFGAARVGAVSPTQTLTIANGITSDPYQESLVYLENLPQNKGYGFAGALYGTIDSGASASVTYSLNTTQAGDFTGVQMPVTETSQGGSDGLGNTALTGATVTLNGKVYAPAIPAIPFGTGTFYAHEGTNDTLSLVVYNAATGALTDTLTGGFASVTGPWQGSGGLNVASGGSGDLSLTLNSATDGVVSGTASFALDSHDSALPDLPVSYGSIALTGKVYAYADPILSATSFNFGAVRTGTTVAGQPLTISDGTVADPYQEALSAIILQAPAGLTYTGSLPGSIASGAGGTVDIKEVTSLSGLYTNAPIVVDFTSDGASGTGFGNTPLAAQTVEVSGAVYAPAKPAGVFGNISFGIVHVGQTASYNMVVSNLATGALSDVLTGGWTSVSTSFNDSGSLTGVAAGSSGTLTIGLSTSTPGIYSGTATVTLASHDSALSDLSLGTDTITLQGQVYNYAAGGFESVRGSAGTLSGTGTNYTLDLGSMLIGSASVTAEVAAFNDVVGPSDRLTGTLNASASPVFTTSALTGFGPLSAQQIGEEPTITLNPTQVGTYQEQIVLTGTGSNNGGYSGAVAPVTLTVVGTVNPLPTVWNLTHTNTDIVASAANDTFNATNGVLWSGDTIDGGGGVNTLDLNGYGQFNLDQPTLLTDIQIVNASEGQRSYQPSGQPFIPGTNQTIFLRNGLNVTLDVAPDASINPSNPNPATINIYGANDSSVINLSSTTGNDYVTLGSATETVTGGSGNDTYYVTATTIGSSITGGSGKSTLQVSGGGAVTMGSNLVAITNIVLNETIGAPAFVFTANSDPGLGIQDNTDAANTIILGAASDTVNMNAASDHVKATTAFASALIKNPGAGSELEITNSGTVTLNTNTNVGTVKLDAAATVTLSKIAGITALGSGGSGGDTITAGTEQQTITPGGGADTLIASVYHGDVFKDLTANLNGCTIKNFGGASGWNDSIDFTNLSDAHLTWNYTGGKLTVSDGTHSASVSVAGTGLVKADFVPTSDGATGTVFTYHA